ncbi:acyl-CoA dehydrogenase family protein [Haliangium ochraceum]|uniref:Acyl-CoA dehydrogenase domain protein n=1 Tax=Haliangium ochraceum (strain DSM 14365 / JCM 11303 / SMP-2) TaxID=502025 RepID=D0LNP1_HALO1|nr:acyl-CoA dehydrogenase family protein [Haliangium ochraceum]ACY16946.1 acyl-CoA dehydrogenase domain protein [Haliangium ochraceum DSM 14365]
MKFTEQHRALQQTLRRLIDEEINPHVDAWEEAGAFPAHEVFRKLGAQGLLGVTKPERYGGMGLDYSYSLAMAEALGAIRCGGVPMAIGVQTDMATPALARYGSEELCERFLRPTISGEFVVCLGVSEVGAGSDVAAIRTHARRDGDDYLIRGSKMWITNGTQADYMVLLANTGDGEPHRNKSLLCVPMDTPGVQVARKLDKLGMRCSDTAEVVFEDVRIPQRFRIGEEGKGFLYQMQQFQEERLWGATAWLVPMDQAIADTIAYTREREVFGKPLIDNQVIHYRLAELATEVEMLRALVYRAVELYIGGEDVTRLASMVKLKAGRLSREVADSCLQYYGGMGFMNETPISRLYRDCRITSIGGGADEVMLSIICKTMGILPRGK